MSNHPAAKIHPELVAINALGMHLDLGGCDLCRPGPTESEMRTLTRIRIGTLKGPATSIEDARNVQRLRELGLAEWTGAKWVAT